MWKVAASPSTSTSTVGQDDLTGMVRVDDLGMRASAQRLDASSRRIARCGRGVVRFAEIAQLACELTQG
jgi:hypothetical protein